MLVSGLEAGLEDLGQRIEMIRQAAASLPCLVCWELSGRPLEQSIGPSVQLGPLGPGGQTKSTKLGKSKVLVFSRV